MKKLATILLISLFAFNLFGYRILLSFAEHRADDRLERSLNTNQYLEEELFAIRFPVPMPYLVSSNQFERCDGEIELDGIIYRYVKKNIRDGQLTLLCLPDRAKMHLAKARNLLVKTAADLPGSSSGDDNSTKQSTAKKMNGDYQGTSASYGLIACNVLQTPGGIGNYTLLDSPFQECDERPPQEG